MAIKMNIFWRKFYIVYCKASAKKLIISIKRCFGFFADAKQIPPTAHFLQCMKGEKDDMYTVITAQCPMQITWLKHSREVTAQGTKVWIKTSSGNTVYLKRHMTLLCYCWTSHQMKAKIMENVMFFTSKLQLEPIYLFSKRLQRWWQLWAWMLALSKFFHHIVCSSLETTQQLS